MFATMPDRADSVDDVTSGQVIAASQFRVTGPAPAQRAALAKKTRAGGTVDCAVHAAAAEQ
jgi:hypothetical protein